MIKLLIALTGILFGFLLTKIAPEELNDGRNYFILMEKIIFVLLFGTINYYFLIEKMMVYLVLFTVLMITLFILNLKLKKQILKVPTYIIFIILYFIIQQTNYQLLIASLIFLYGLPVGTLIKK